jgi:hypothetical protein
MNPSNDPRDDPDRSEALMGMMDAATHGNPDALSNIIERELRQFGSLPSGSIEALSECARLGRLECLRVLLPHCDPNPVDLSGPPPLVIAAGAGRLDCVLALLPLSDPNRPCPWSDQLPAFRALLNGHVECFEALAPSTDFAKAPALDEPWRRDLAMFCATDELAHALKAALPYCDLNARDARGFSALTWAAMNNSMAAVEILLPLFDPRELTPKGNSPASIADRHNYGNVAQVLRARAEALDERDALALAAGAPCPRPPKPRL